MRELTLPRLLCLPLVLALLGGCSTYRPLYGRTEANGSVATELSTIAVAEQTQRAGQLVRNELISSFGGQPSSSRYVLKLDVTEKTQDVSSLADSNVERHRYRLSVNYQLVEASSGKELSSGKSFSNVSYDTVEEPVADLQAAENARERAARELAQDIRLRLSAFLSG